MTGNRFFRIKCKVVGDCIVRFSVITEIDYEKAPRYIEADIRNTQPEDTGIKKCGNTDAGDLQSLIIT